QTQQLNLMLCRHDGKGVHALGEWRFFFSSRRRHTRSKRDWSSDVCSSDLGRRRRVPQLHGVRSVVLFRQVDQLPVVRLAQQLLYLSRLDRRFVPLDLRHRLAELLRAHRAGLPAQPTDGLLDEAERAVQGKRAAAPFPGGREGGRLVRRDRLCARLTLVTPPPTPPPAATAFAALALAWSVEGRQARRLRCRSGHARTQPDLVLAVIELGEGDEALVRRLDHEFREA